MGAAGGWVRVYLGVGDEAEVVPAKDDLVEAVHGGCAQGGGRGRVGPAATGFLHRHGFLRCGERFGVFGGM